VNAELSLLHAGYGARRSAWPDKSIDQLLRRARLEKVSGKHVMLLNSGVNAPSSASALTARAIVIIKMMIKDLKGRLNCMYPPKFNFRAAHDSCFSQLGTISQCWEKVAQAYNYRAEMTLEKSDRVRVSSTLL